MNTSVLYFSRGPTPARRRLRAVALGVSRTLVGGLLLIAEPAAAQWLKHPSPGTPRTKDGKPILTAPAPKRPDGRPDLSGIWQAEPDPQGRPEGVENDVNPRYFVNVAADRQKPDDLAFQPWAIDLFHQRLESEGREDPLARCVPPGVPAINTFPIPFKIVQGSRLLVMLYEVETTFRQVFVDGRKHPPDPLPSFAGYSIGKWEGRTLVVDSVGFKDRGWLDRMGHPHSDALHLVERFTRRDFGHMDIAMTIDDPKTYTQPFSYTQRAVLLPDTDLIEYHCSENERDVPHYK